MYRFVSIFIAVFLSLQITAQAQPYTPTLPPDTNFIFGLNWYENSVGADSIGFNRLVSDTLGFNLFHTGGDSMTNVGLAGQYVYISPYITEFSSAQRLLYTTVPNSQIKILYPNFISSEWIVY